MIAAFLAAEGDYAGRWERDEPDHDDPLARWIVRAVALALAVFWGLVLTSAVALLP